MIQKAMHCFESECGKIKVCVDSDLAIGKFHDFLLELKAIMVDRMVAAHRQQEEENFRKKLEDEKQNPCCGSGEEVNNGS